MTQSDVRLVEPSAHDATEFLDAVHQSRGLHRPWAYPPATKERFDSWLARNQLPQHASWFVRRQGDGALIGVINVSEIGGRWRDHEHWALLVEDWRASPRVPRARQAT